MEENQKTTLFLSSLDPELLKQFNLARGDLTQSEFANDLFRFALPLFKKTESAHAVFELPKEESTPKKKS